MIASTWGVIKWLVDEVEDARRAVKDYRTVADDLRIALAEAEAHLENQKMDADAAAAEVDRLRTAIDFRNDTIARLRKTYDDRIIELTSEKERLSAKCKKLSAECDALRIANAALAEDWKAKH